MSALRRVAWPAALLTGLLGVDIVFRPFPFGFAFRAWLVALGAVAAASMVIASLAPYRRVRVEAVRFRRRVAPATQRPPGLEEVERAVDFATWNSADLDRRLRPLLRKVAAHRLLSRRGIDLERSPELARHLLGEVAWDLIAPPAAGADGRGPGVSPLVIGEAVQRLEEI